MEQTYKKNIEEFGRLKARKERVNAGLCATCGRPENHDEVTEFGTFTHQWDDGIDARVFNELSHLTSAHINMIDAFLELIGEDEVMLEEKDLVCWEINKIRNTQNQERSRLRTILEGEKQKILQVNK